MKNRNEKDRISAFLFIVVFLLVVTIVVLILKSINNHKSDEPEQPVYQPTQGEQIPESDPNAIVETDPNVPAVTYTPVDTLPTAPSSAPAVTQAPPPTQAPAPPQAPAPTRAPPPTTAPTATPAPTQTPSYTPVNLGSGSFESETGTYLNIHADWSAKTVSSTQVEVTVKVYCDHYSLYTSKLYGAVGILLDGQYASLDSPAIEHDSNDLKHTELATRTFTIDLQEGQSRTFGLHVEWGYGGEYGGPNGRVQLDSLECGGSITLSR